MTKYAKALSAFGVSLVGLFVTFGFFDDVQAQAMGAVITAAANLAAVFLVPNKKVDT